LSWALDAHEAIGTESRLKPEWEGDLDDDCIAHWSGLVLRAEEMDRLYWWWAVYASEQGEPVVDSHESATVAKNGEEARMAAEAAARNWLSRREAK
jgi:hypothetical protein